MEDRNRAKRGGKTFGVFFLSMEAPSPAKKPPEEILLEKLVEHRR